MTDNEADQDCVASGLLPPSYTCLLSSCIVSGIVRFIIAINYVRVHLLTDTFSLGHKLYYFCLGTTSC